MTSESARSSGPLSSWSASIDRPPEAGQRRARSATKRCLRPPRPWIARPKYLPCTRNAWHASVWVSARAEWPSGHWWVGPRWPIRRREGQVLGLRSKVLYAKKGWQGEPAEAARGSGAWFAYRSTLRWVVKAWPPRRKPCRREKTTRVPANSNTAQASVSQEHSNAPSIRGALGSSAQCRHRRRQAEGSEAPQHRCPGSLKTPWRSRTTGTAKLVPLHLQFPKAGSHDGGGRHGGRRPSVGGRSRPRAGSHARTC